jgi:hypothetical protein
MRKHRALLIATAFVGLALTLALLLRHDDEPRYNGRPLSKWLQVYSENVMSQNTPEFSEAEQAIRTIGTNALPYLLKWIQQQPPPWHRTAHRKLPESVSDSAPVRLLIDGRGYETANGAMLAFDILGSNAAPAIPEMVAAMNGTTNRTTAVRIIAALSGIGAPALPHMAAALSNTNQTGRSAIPAYIRLMARHVGTNACLPPLTAALQDPDPAVRSSASWALSKLAPDLLTNAPTQ